MNHCPIKRNHSPSAGAVQTKTCRVPLLTISGAPNRKHNPKTPNTPPELHPHPLNHRPLLSTQAPPLAPPTAQEPYLARVSATLRRRGSLRKPMPWCSLARTQDRMIRSFSRPWKASTLAISTSWRTERRSRRREEERGGDDSSALVSSCHR